MTKKKQEQAVRAVARKCRGGLPEKARRKVNALIAEGRLEEARSLDRAERTGCGYDFNEVVLSQPLDGKTHEFKCPGCGTRGTYRAPLF